MSAENGAIAAWSHDLESPMAGARTYMSRSHASRRATGGQAATTRPDHRRSAAATLAARLVPKPARNDAQASAPADIAARRRTSIDIEAATMGPSTETRQEPRPPTLAGQRRQRPLVVVRRNGGDERHRQHGQRGDAAHHRCDGSRCAFGWPGFRWAGPSDRRATPEARADAASARSMPMSMPSVLTCEGTGSRPFTSPGSLGAGRCPFPLPASACTSTTRRRPQRGDIRTGVPTRRRAAGRPRQATPGRRPGPRPGAARS
jgi:hypothetical protein